MNNQEITLEELIRQVEIASGSLIVRSKIDKLAFKSVLLKLYGKKILRDYCE